MLEIRELERDAFIVCTRRTNEHDLVVKQSQCVWLRSSHSAARLDVRERLFLYTLYKVLYAICCEPKDFLVSWYRFSAEQAGSCRTLGLSPVEIRIVIDYNAKLTHQTKHNEIRTESLDIVTTGNGSPFVTVAFTAVESLLGSTNLCINLVRLIGQNVLRVLIRLLSACLINPLISFSDLVWLDKPLVKRLLVGRRSLWQY